MNFEIKFLPQFMEQLNKLNLEQKLQIDKKVELIKQNPYRFKKIHSKKFNRVFRVRLKLSGKEQRLIYVILKSNVIVVCLLDRDKGYNDLEKYLSVV